MSFLGFSRFLRFQIDFNFELGKDYEIFSDILSAVAWFGSDSCHTENLFETKILKFHLNFQNFYDIGGKRLNHLFSPMQWSIVAITRKWKNQLSRFKYMDCRSWRTLQTWMWQWVHSQYRTCKYIKCHQGHPDKFN